jgi:hypothetical protein
MPALPGGMAGLQASQEGQPDPAQQILPARQASPHPEQAGQTGQAEQIKQAKPAGQAEGGKPQKNQRTPACQDRQRDAGQNENHNRNQNRSDGQTSQTSTSQTSQTGGTLAASADPGDRATGAMPQDQAEGIPQPAGPAGSLGETARLLGEAEAIKLKTRLAKEEAACLKAQIETARLRRELAAADQHSAAGAHATLQARTPRDAATGDAPSDAAGNAPDVQSSGASGASQATAAPARPAGSATGATAAGTAHPAPQASPALALHSLGRIVSIQDIGGTLTAAVRTPSGALAMLKPGSRWAGGRVTAVTPRGLRLKLGARTLAVPF